ncbi:Acyltransferase [Aphelenchoides fujianensis]|nr:Acyltransferase [Aphelenchoides fujianensis]
MAEAASVPLLPAPVGPKERAPSAGLRADVQFLRALAIGGVLLFHLWPRWLPFGYLGVDLFFVISGYLMAAIMSRRRPLSRPAVLDFYFRRLKRIVPPFQLVVLLVLGLVRLHVLPLDFSQVVAETWPALGFFSNTPGLREHKYFDMLPLVLLLPAASLGFQWTADGDRAHFLLVARVWQFFAGFGAHLAHSRRLLDFGASGEGGRCSSVGRLLEVLNVGLLCALFVFGIPTASAQCVRLALEAEDEAAPASGGRACPPEICAEVRRLWAAGGPPPAANLTEIRRLNANLRRAYVGFPFCANQSRRMPTSFPLDLTRFHSVYTLHNFPGIQYVWRSTYRRLTLLMRNSCMPADRRFQQPARTAAVVDECVRFLNDSTRALEQWDEPVDVVIALFALVEIADVPLDEANAEADEFLRSLSAYFGRLSRVAREVLVVQQSFPVFSQIPVREVELRVKNGRSLDEIGDPAEFAYAQQPSARRRMELLDCGRCVKVDLLAEWCGSRDAAAFCPSASPAGLVHFVDTHHPTALSAFRNAQLMLDLYTNCTNG